MKSLLLFLATLCAPALWAQSSLHLTAGQSYSYEFSTVPFVQPGALVSPGGGGIFYLATPNLEVGSQVLVEMFENRTDTAPFKTSRFVLTEWTSEVNVGGTGVWQDLEGRMRLNVLTGAVDLTGLEVRVFGGPGPAIEFNAYGYNQIIPIPEPSTWSLVGVGLVAIGARTLIRRRRNASASRCFRHYEIRDAAEHR